MALDLEDFFLTYEDHLAPKLDTYEQAIYLYIFRHTRFIGLGDAVIGFKSARSRMATGIGQAGSPMSESTIYLKLASLQQKGCLKTISVEHRGRRVNLMLPREIEGLIAVERPSNSTQDIEDIDFFTVDANRLLIFEREQGRCFYTMRKLTKAEFVIDHILSRPTGTHSYRNVVASSRDANNRKGSMPASDFLRKLFREGFLSDSELEERLQCLQDTLIGKRKPQERL